MTISVLINAGPWLPVPPPTYSGIENILATLIPELRRRGVHVVLATVGASTLPVDERIVIYDQPQFQYLQQPYNQVMGVAHGHLQGVVGELRKRSDIDLCTITSKSSGRPSSPRWESPGRRYSIRCTGTYANTRISTAASTAEDESWSTAFPQPSSRPPLGHCEPTASATRTWPHRWRGTRIGSRDRSRGTTSWCSAGSRPSRASISRPGWPDGWVCR